MILFINIVHTRKITIERLRRRFTKIFINIRISRALFDDLTIKKLFIFNFIDFYNYFINNINIIDQLKNYYNIQQVYNKI